jgi:hypothetical protein
LPALFNLIHSTFHPAFLCSLFRVFPEAESVFVAELSPGVVVLAAEPGVSAAVSAAAGLSPGVVVLGVEPGVVFASEPQASVDIAAASVVLAPVSVFAVEVYIPGRPRSPAFPNAYHYAMSSSSVEVAGQESVQSSTGVRANHGFGSILSNPGLHQNKNLGQCYNSSNLGCNSVSDTNDLPIGATTSRSRKKGLHRCRERRTHRPYQAIRSHPEAPQMQWVAERYQYLYSPPQLLAEERQLPTPKAMSLEKTFSFCCLLYT